MASQACVIRRSTSGVSSNGTRLPPMDYVMGHYPSLAAARRAISAIRTQLVAGMAECEVDSAYPIPRSEGHWIIGTWPEGTRVNITDWIDVEG